MHAKYIKIPTFYSKRIQFLDKRQSGVPTKQTITSSSQYLLENFFSFVTEKSVDQEFLNNPEVYSNQIDKYFDRLSNNQITALLMLLCYQGNGDSILTKVVRKLIKNIDKDNSLSILNVLLKVSNKLQQLLSNFAIHKLNTLNATQNNLQDSLANSLQQIQQVVANILNLESAQGDKSKLLNSQWKQTFSGGYNIYKSLKHETGNHFNLSSNSEYFSLEVMNGYIKNSSPLSRDIAHGSNSEVAFYNNIFRVGIATLLSSIKNKSKQQLKSEFNQLISLQKEYMLYLSKANIKNEQPFLWTDFDKKAAYKFLSMKRGRGTLGILHRMLGDLYPSRSAKEFKQVLAAKSSLNLSDKQSYSEIKNRIENKHIDYKDTLELKFIVKILLKNKDYQLLNTLLVGVKEFINDDQVDYKVRQSVATNFSGMIFKLNYSSQSQKDEFSSIYFKKLQNKFGKQRVTAFDHLQQLRNNLVNCKELVIGQESLILDQLAGINSCIDSYQQIIMQSPLYKGFASFTYGDYLGFITKHAYDNKSSLLQTHSILANAIYNSENISQIEKKSLIAYCMDQIKNSHSTNFNVLHKKRFNLIRNVSVDGISNGLSNLKYDILFAQDAVDRSNIGFSLGAKVPIYGLSSFLSTASAGILSNYYSKKDTISSKSVTSIMRSYLQSLRYLEKENSCNLLSSSEVSINSKKLINVGAESFLFDKVVLTIGHYLNTKDIAGLISYIGKISDLNLLYLVLTHKTDKHCVLSSIFGCDMSVEYKKELLQIFLKCYKSHYNKMVELQIYKPSISDINDIENWRLSQLASFIKQESISNANEAYKMSLIIIASIDLDQNLPQAKAKHRYFAGVIKRSVTDKSSKLRVLRKLDFSANNWRRTFFKSAVATFACILGVVTVASGIGTIATLGFFMLISIAKNLANLAYDNFDSYNTREYLQIMDMLSLHNPEHIANVVVELDDESLISKGKDEEDSFFSKLLRNSMSLYQRLSNDNIIRSNNASEMLEGFQQELYNSSQISPVIEDQVESNITVVFDNLQVSNIGNSRVANYGNTKVANKDEAHKIKSFTTDDIIRVTEIAKDINNDSINKLGKHFNLILDQDFSEFASDDLSLLVSINQRVASLDDNDLEQFVMSEALNLLNQSLDKYSLNQAFYRIIAIVFLSGIQMPTKFNIFNSILEEMESGKNSYSNILNRHNSIISERKYLVYDVAIGVATSFVDMVGLHVFDFSSVGQMALSGIAGAVSQIIDLKSNQNKDKNQPKTKSAKNIQNLLRSLIYLQDKLNNDSEVDVIMA